MSIYIKIEDLFFLPTTVDIQPYISFTCIA